VIADQYPASGNQVPPRRQPENRCLAGAQGGRPREPMAETIVHTLRESSITLDHILEEVRNDLVGPPKLRPKSPVRMFPKQSWPLGSFLLDHPVFRGVWIVWSASLGC
jgi:hypothetical protein